MDAMVDGVHSTDLGMQQYADSYRKKIGEILHEESEGTYFMYPLQAAKRSIRLVRTPRRDLETK